MSDETAEQVIERALRGAGLSDLPAEYDSDIHRWRCSYPDIYGPCSCFSETVTDITAALREAGLLAGGEPITGQELHCDDCQQPYAVWFADNAEWNWVMSGGATTSPEWPGMLCPRCFTVRAEVVYGRPVHWYLSGRHVGGGRDDCGRTTDALIDGR
jgi:hypothetical protein